jgi:CDP-diacylglycerol--serine O-phosphatidyltransferase
MKKMFIGTYNGSEILTLLGLGFAALGIFSSISGNVLHGVFCLMFAAMCDGFDGIVARRIKRDKAAEFYGIELDSLVDVVSFGALPVVIGWSLGLTTLPDVFIFAFYICCGVIRLAHFNTLTLVGGKTSKPGHFTGLPITTAAIIVPLCYLLFEAFSVPVGAYRFVYFFTGLFYILNIKIKKPGLAFRMILCAAGLAVIILLLLRGA